MSTYFKVKNWDVFQHYKDRNPPWIKLHNHLLDNYEFECLPDASKSHLLCIWMLASRTQNKMPMDSAWLKRKIGASSSIDLPLLVKSGFIEEIQEVQGVEQTASDALDSEEKRRGRGEAEERREEKSDNPDAVLVISHFNKVTGQKLKASSKSHAKHICGRLSDGHSVEELNMVIDSKFREWGSDPKMAQFVRPSTLFQPEKFNGYLMAAKATPSPKSSLHDISGVKYESGDL